MSLQKMILVVVCVAVFGSAAARPASAQCNSSPDQAVQCFVNNAVKSGLTSPRYGMTMSQFRAYGVSVSKILQTDQTYLVLMGASSAIADAMPPTNADGSSNVSAQQTAITQIVNAALANGLAPLPAATTQQDVDYFSMDIVDAMNTSGGYLQLLTPGTPLRLIDSYIVTGTTNGVANWSTINASLSTAIDNMTKSGLIKIPVGLSTVQVKSFVNSIAQTIWSYRQSTQRAHL